MSMIISDECISCDVCESECPNSAISLGDEHYQIAPERCTECVGYYESPQCAEVCPVDCISKDKNNPESHETLLFKFQTLMAGE